MLDAWATSLVGVTISVGTLIVATLIGFAALAWLMLRTAGGLIPTRLALLSPAVGIAIVTLCATWLNVGGLPVRAFAYPLSAALVALAVVGLAIRRPRINVYQLLPFFVIIAAAFLLVGRPLFEFGTDWLGFSNDDMANYCLEAQRQIDHAFMAFPNPFDWVHLRDASLYYWSSTAIASERQGVQAFLAVVSVVARVYPLQAFMPVIVAFQMMLVSAACAMVAGATTVRLRAAVVAGALFAVSALVALGSVAQLFAQVCGIGLLVGAATAIAIALRVPRFGGIALAAILTGGTAIVYPEITPFLGLGCVIYAVVNLFRRKLRARPIIVGGLVIACLAGILVNVAWRTYVFTLLPQIVHGTNVVGQFWYFLVPSGPANLFGLLPIGSPPDAYGIDAFIVAGHIVLLVWLVMVARSAWRGELVGAFAASMALFGVDLFARRADFGLFKLAMFIQPFLLGVVAVGITRLWLLRGSHSRGARWIAGVLFALFFTGNIIVQQFYIERSRAITSEFRVNSFAEVPYASSSRMLGKFAEAARFAAPADRYASDTMNFTLAKIESAFTRTHELLFFSEDFFFNIAGVPRTGYEVPRLSAIDADLDEQRAKMFVPRQFDVRSVAGTPLADEFVSGARLMETVASPYTWLFESSAEESVLNRLALGMEPSQAPNLVPLASVRDHLVFMDSTLGRNYRQTLGLSKSPAGLFPPEPDNALGHGSTMAGIGRYALFMVLGPERDLRMEISLTVTSKGRSILPHVVAYGVRPAVFHLLGRGSARAVSDPIQPITIGGAQYILLDMGVDATTFPDRRKGLMNIYGRDVVIDRRRTTAFIRDLSVVTARQLLVERPPAAIATFPGDLRDADLRYSGFYEDGWASEDSSITLSRGEGQNLVFSGLVPRIGNDDFVTQLTLSIDGRIVRKLRMESGYFRLRIPAPGWLRVGRHTIRLTFARGQVLPRGDGRVVGAQVAFLGFAR